MITSKVILKEYIAADKSRNMVNCSRKYLLIEPFLSLFGVVRESFYVRKYLLVLRKLEYYINVRTHFGGGYLMRIYYTIKWKRLSNKYGIYIHPNTVGKGLYIPHFNGGIQLNCISMGDFCSVSSGVVVGNKGSQDNRAIIGNNVGLTIGCKVIGKVVLGNNVIVAPNSVVIKDVPDNAIVSGIPAKQINKHNQLES
ncbi:serine acetyltransferase [Segatella copri]|uniref:serine acetyltransferase n=1 Tax=Segatella copri TaxID=165179 RepID=UPI001C48B8B6|nr:serine acetyltransferase [Segatella copri]MBW0037955.1 serine acetyltransferase [Segatella copri]